MKVGKTIKKVSVLSGVCDGFIGNRMLAKRSREGMFMLEEGATPWQIDKVLYDFGFAMGPYQVADLAGIDVQYAARKARWNLLSDREHKANIVDQLSMRWAGTVRRPAPAITSMTTSGRARPTLRSRR